MPGTSPVILILGAGPNIGQAVARTFASKGYKVALTARSLREADSTDNQLNITSDFANPDQCSRWTGSNWISNGYYPLDWIWIVFFKIQWISRVQWISIG